MVIDALDEIVMPGAFAAQHRMPADNLRLEVEGVGPIRFPVSKSMATLLCGVARLARHGMKERTVLDVAVRDTWEIAKSKVKIDQRAWKAALTPALGEIRDALGLVASVELDARLHSLLVYAPGQFFVPHQDSEKGEGMIGTLVVTLPSAFEGGAIVVEHHGEKVTQRGSRDDELTLIAFYADCHHEVRPVKSGYRIVLTYDLFVSGSGAANVEIPAKQIDLLERQLKDFFDTVPPVNWPGVVPQAPDRLVYLLDHQYTQHGLQWSRLKGDDAARVAALREVAVRLECEAVLALADVHESWSCEDEDDGYRGYGRRRWYTEDADDDDEREKEQSVRADGEVFPELIELVGSDIELRHFVDGNGRGLDVSSYVQNEELHFTKPTRELDPFRSQHEGYMGNWGNTVDHWYHRAALVLWPRARAFVIQAKTSARFAVDTIAKTLGRGELSQARQMVRDVLPFWPRLPGTEPAKVLTKTLKVAHALDAADLATGLLRPFRIEDLSAKHAPALAALVERYGMKWFRGPCQAFASAGDDTEDARPAVRRSILIRELPAFVSALCSSESTVKAQLAKYVLTEQWKLLIARHEAAMSASPSAVLHQLVKLNGPILGLVESSLIADASDVHERVVRFLTSERSPTLALTSLLDAAPDLHALKLEAVRTRVLDQLAKELSVPARSDEDWSIAAPFECTCYLCKELRRFLADKVQVRLAWPIAKEKRAHIHRCLDLHELPVTHVTHRMGSPHTLVLTKTRALFNRETEDRAAKQSALTRLQRRGAKSSFTNPSQVRRADSPPKRLRATE